MAEENKKQDTQENINAKDFIIGALVGGIVGAASALLLAPKSGKELRNDLNEQANVLRDRSESFRDTAVTKGSELVAVAKEKTSALTQAVSEQSTDIVNKVKSNNVLENMEETKEAITDTAEELQDDIGNVGDELQSKLEETKKALEDTEKQYQEN